MHFDARTQRALREAGLDADAIATASDRVAGLVAADADRLRAFFGADGTYYSDMDLAHSTAEVQEHASADVDLFTHGGDLRGYLSLDGWGVAVEDGRVLRSEADTAGSADNDGRDGDSADGNSAESANGDRPVLVELSLGPTVHDRVRFARERDEL
ncbi:DUF7532 family protein [Halorubrum sp. DTA46]|uniref:DUF7532 family protein n=1 Tax=Halorubrum sp. DTA46 TaxID=3402162 RepID=UPI003AB07A45